MTAPHPSQFSLAAGVRRALAWSAMTNVALRFGTLALGIALARLLAPEDFGVYAVGLSVQAVLMTLADLGLSADLVRCSDPERRAPTVASLGLASGTLLALVMVVTAEPFSRAVGVPEASPVVALLGITLVLAGAGVVPFAILQRELRQRALFGIAATDLVVSTTVTLGLVLSGWGALALAVGRVVAQAVTLMLLHVVTRHRPRFSFDRRVAAAVLGFGLPVAGANLLSWVLLNLDNLVVARVAGATALGFYVLAFNISTWPMTAVGQVVRSVALPAFSRAGERTRGRALLHSTGLTAALALPAGALLAVLAAPLVALVYGERWLAAAPVLAALALFGALRVVFDLWVSYLLARGAARAVLLVQVLWFVALVPAVVVGTRLGGITGAGWAHVVVAAVVVLPAYAVVLARHGARLPALGRACLAPLAATMLAALSAGAVAAVLDARWQQLVLGGAAAGLVYLVVLGRWLRRTVAAFGTEPARPPLVAAPRPGCPTVSVVVPCHDYARYLPEAVHSALDQEGVTVEVIVVDDASSDDSLGVARRLAAADPRVRVLAHEDNQGPVSTFNDGLADATGEFLVRLDADDLLTPGSLARAAALCQAHPGVGLVYGHPLHFSGGERPTARTGPVTWTVWPGRTWLADRCRSGVNVITSPEAFMRMSVVRQVGGQRELAHTHDLEMWLRLAAVSDVAYVGGADQAWHREHSASLSRTAESDLGLTLLAERQQAFETLFAGPIGDFPDAASLRDLARASLAAEALARACYEYDRRRAPARSVDPLTAFALQTWPRARELPQWRALQRRSAAGAAWTSRHPWFLLHPVRRMARDRRAARRWRRQGVYRPLPARRTRPRRTDEGVPA